MKLARYRGGGLISIEDEAAPSLPSGGLLVQTEACGLCSGELMDWYMDRKIPHVLGHEVCGRVIESDDERFPVGARVFPHHHAPCGTCEVCRRGHPVHCATWKSTKLLPGGMSEQFAVPAANLADTLIVDDLGAREAALIEPLACVMKSLRRGRHQPGDRVAVIGLGAMGLLHALVAGPETVGIDLHPDRIAWAQRQGIRTEPSGVADLIIVCPGSGAAVESALALAAPGARIVLFAPLPPGQPLALDLEALYFRDLELITCYSCGPEDTRAAAEVLRAGTVRAEQVVSDFIELDELPAAYQRMKQQQILKAMVLFST